MVTIQGNHVEFSFYRPGAGRIAVAGDFNGWKTDDLVMSPAGDGNWTVRARIPAGEYRFRYCADGEWFTDYAACGVEPGRFGMDSIVTVPARPIKVQQRTAESQTDAESIHVA